MKDAHKKFTESEVFQEFLKNEEGFEFVHAYLIKEHGKKSHWEFGYYHPIRDKIVVFETNPVKITPEQDAFKDGGTIKKLDTSKINISFDELMNKCEEIRKEMYSSELATKYIVILQNLHKQIWNVTLVTRAFNLINIKIDAQTGELVSTNMHSMLDLGVRQSSRND